MIITTSNVYTPCKDKLMSYLCSEKKVCILLTQFRELVELAKLTTDITPNPRLHWDDKSSPIWLTIAPNLSMWSYWTTPPHDKVIINYNDVCNYTTDLDI